MEEQNNNKSSKQLIVLIVVVALISILCGGILNLKAKTPDSKEENKNEEIIKPDNTSEPEKPIAPEKTDEPKEEEKADVNKDPAITEELLTVDNSVKEKITTFINIGSSYEIFDYFKKGVTGIDEETKHTMAYIAINSENGINKSETNIFTQEDIDSLRISQDLLNYNYYTIQLYAFKSKYKELFNEEDRAFQYYFSSYCPVPVAYSEAKNLIYLTHECGGSYRSFEKEIVNIVSDNTYYYANVMYKYALMDGQTEQETLPLIWKFDENLKFVGTGL